MFGREFNFGGLVIGDGNTKFNESTEVHNPRRDYCDNNIILNNYTILLPLE